MDEYEAGESVKRIAQQGLGRSVKEEWECPESSFCGLRE
jgi:hypothetical protein